MRETEHAPPLPRSQDILARYRDAFTALQHNPTTATERAWCMAADRLDAALLMLPGRVELGQLVATPGALSALERAEQLPAEFLLPHKQGDWGELDPHDHQVNENALQQRGRIVSVYRTRRNDPLWVITDAGWKVTTLLLPEEY